ncbi:isoleucine--tRNA ligase [Verrucomicrobiales bacterium]|nr:isoleucine--tRNA ligase [Verrucomicrobiales bacterium]
MSDAKKSGYKHTLQLPKTEFPMRGDLVKREPARLEDWEKEGLYRKITDARKAAGAETFILHDGPPFANGDAHMGTALNKVLKDFVVKSKTMAGFHCPFVPGWDCHGLPIEFKVVKESRGLSPVEIRERSEAYAKKFIDIQKASFRRLGVFGDWDKPYLTLNPGYEADVVRTFAKFVEQGLVYRSKKPVLWSYGAQTALAEAEVDYEDKVSPAVYVKFPLAGAEDGASFVIWTTTPWTLPSNLGIALHPDFEYVRGEFAHEDGRSETLIIGRELLADFAAKTGFSQKDANSHTATKGSELAGGEAQHPFIDRTSRIITGRFVTAEAGTGAVHIAPGHGADDYMAGQEHGLGVLSPVNDEGKFTSDVEIDNLVGLHVFQANKPIIALLEEKGVLLGQEEYKHQYPFCWRSKTPIIFRAVEQYFIKIDSIRETALSEIDRVSWLPHWGRNRIHGTVESRPDWCISRQRTWGVPLPIFYAPDGEALIDPALARKTADLFEKDGTNLWFNKDDAWWADTLGLAEGTTRCRDTLDVWIDSGTSHVAVLDAHPELHCPADLYLEATDQHRGWFQSSLMVSIAARGAAPYKTVLTHGFVVDQDKKKISKSAAEKAGKPIDAAYFFNKYGADMVRLWVSSVDWQNEVPFGEDLFKQTANSYRSLRNILRILLANTDGFDPAKDTPGDDAYSVIDHWILERLHQVTTECREAYQAYEFRKVFNTVNQFCSVDLSALYVDITKDRLYCDAIDSPRRRASQAVMHTVADALCRLLSPVLAYTADEAWSFLGNSESVHLSEFPSADAAHAGTAASDKIAQLLRARDLAQVSIDAATKSGAIKKRERAQVTFSIPENDPALPVLADKEAALEFLMLSDFSIETADTASAAVTETRHSECPRCRRSIPLAEDSEVCPRCAAAIA